MEYESEIHFGDKNLSQKQLGPHGPLYWCLIIQRNTFGCFLYRKVGRLRKKTSRRSNVKHPPSHYHLQLPQQCTRIRQI